MKKKSSLHCLLHFLFFSILNISDIGGPTSTPSTDIGGTTTTPKGNSDPALTATIAKAETF